MAKKKTIIQDESSELAAIYLATVANQQYLGLLSRLRPHHFFDPGLSTIWAVVLDRARKGEDYGYINIRAALKESGEELAAKRMTDVIAKSEAGMGDHRTLDLSALQSYIIDLWQQREHIKISEESQKGLLSLQEAIQAMQEVLTESTENTAEKPADLAMKVMEQVEQKIVAARTGQPLPGSLRFGIPKLDARGGMQAGELVIIAGRTAMGKSTIARISAQDTARDYPTLFLTQEMTKEEVLTLMACSLGGVDSSRVRAGAITDDEHDDFIDGMAKVTRLDLTLSYFTDLTSVEAACRAWRMKTDIRKPGIIYLDYLQQVANPMPGRTRNDEVGGVSRAMKQLAINLNCAIVALAQLSRAVEKRQDKMPILSDLRDSGEIEQDANMVIFCYRPEYYDIHEWPEIGGSTEGQMALIIEKNRHGECGMVIETIDLSQSRLIHQPGSYGAPF